MIVTSLADNTTIDGQLTLREALSAANTNASVDGSPAGSGLDEIQFATGLQGTIALSLGPLRITEAVNLVGNVATNIVIDGQLGSRIFQLDDFENNVWLKYLTLTGGRTTEAGSGGRGGAILSLSNAVLTLFQCTLSGNSTSGDGAFGGAIYSDFGAVTLNQCTVSGNSTTGSNADGGAIYVNTGTLTLNQSTVTENHAAMSAGGGVFSSSSLVAVKNSIVAGNTDNGTAPDIRKSPTDALTVLSSLIGDHTGTPLTATAGTTPDAGGNFIGSTTVPMNPHLGPLQNNGGPTDTHALLADSLAIDHGNNSNAFLFSQDQRGYPFTRIVDGPDANATATVDMGAYELFTVTGPIIVSTATDELDYDVSNGDLSLREAVQLANGSPGVDTISFATLTNGVEMNLVLGQMAITEDVTIAGNGATSTVIDGQLLSRVFDITGTAGNVTLNDLTFRNGRTTGNGTSFDDTTFGGGAVHSLSLGILTVNRITFTNNSTSGNLAGGGAILANSGTLIVNQSLFYGNSTGGINSEGGAISAHLGFLQIRNSTFYGNSTTGDYSEGGAVFSVFGNVSISQSTLSGNSISGIDSQGGGLFTQQGLVFITQSTITENETTSSIGGGIFTLSSPITILNSIVARNSDIGVSPDIRKSPDSDDVFFITSSLIGRNNGTGLAATSGATPDASGNFIGGATTQTALNPQLGPLQDNGGPTFTHALLSGSLAIDHGINALAVDVTNGNMALTTDQRGVPFIRVLDGDHLGASTVDMGAVEFSGLRLLSPGPNAFTLRPTLTWTPIAGATSYIIQINNESTNVAHFHDSTSNTATYTPTVDLAIGKFKMWIQPGFNGTLGNWSAPQLFNILTKPTWQTIARTQLTSRPTLIWNALPGAAKYDLQIDNFSTGVKNVIRQDVTGTSFTPAADLPMGLYRCWIRGVDAKGNFANWSVLLELLVVPGPTPVGPLSATFDRTPTFSWNAVAGAVSYELYVRNLTTNAMVINGTSTTATNFTPVSDLAVGLHKWWTIAVSAAFSTGAIKSGGSNSLDIFIGGRPTFITPTTGSSTSDRTPTFSWKPVDGAATYRLQVNRTDVAQNNVINQVGLTGTSFTPVANLAAGTYRAWVMAVSSTGELSPWSIEVNFTVTDVQPAGDVPGIDYRLAGLLVSELAEKDNGTDTSHKTYKSYDETAVEQRQPTPADLPAVEAWEPSDEQLDHLMMEFAITELLGERLGVSPPCNSTLIARLSILSRLNTQFLRDR